MATRVADASTAPFPYAAYGDGSSSHGGDDDVANAGGGNAKLATVRMTQGVVCSLMRKTGGHHQELLLQNTGEKFLDTYQTVPSRRLDGYLITWRRGPLA